MQPPLPGESRINSFAIFPKKYQKKPANKKVKGVIEIVQRLIFDTSIRAVCIGRSDYESVGRGFYCSACSWSRRHSFTFAIINAKELIRASCHVHEVRLILLCLLFEQKAADSIVFLHSVLQHGCHDLKQSVAKARWAAFGCMVLLCTPARNRSFPDPHRHKRSEPLYAEIWKYLTISAMS